MWLYYLFKHELRKKIFSHLTAYECCKFNCLTNFPYFLTESIKEERQLLDFKANVLKGCVFLHCRDDTSLSVSTIFMLIGNGPIILLASYQKCKLKTLTEDRIFFFFARSEFFHCIVDWRVCIDRAFSGEDYSLNSLAYILPHKNCLFALSILDPSGSEKLLAASRG